MEMEVKSFPVEFKAIDDNTFEGYASIFGNVDSYGDIVHPGAFKKTLAEGAKRVKVLWQHNPNIPIGKPIHMEEDSKGLYVKAKVSETSVGKDALILMRDGVVNELSIGYNTIKADDEKTADGRWIRNIRELKLWEFSPVTFAANDMAQIAGVKNQQILTSTLYAINNELKAGKVLSEKNKQLVKQAIEALQALLSAAEPEEDSTPKHDEAALQEIKQMIEAIRSEANHAADRTSLSDLVEMVKGFKVD